jgi:hypothetical protein
LAYLSQLCFVSLFTPSSEYPTPSARHYSQSPRPDALHPRLLLYSSDNKRAAEMCLMRAEANPPGRTTRDHGYPGGSTTGEQQVRKSSETLKLSENLRVGQVSTTHLHEHVPRMFELERRHPVPRAAGPEPTDPGRVCRAARQTGCTRCAAEVAVGTVLALVAGLAATRTRLTDGNGRREQ